LGPTVVICDQVPVPILRLMRKPFSLLLLSRQVRLTSDAVATVAADTAGAAGIVRAGLPSDNLYHGLS
jgi:hypothetical protein